MQLASVGYLRRSSKKIKQFNVLAVGVAVVLAATSLISKTKFLFLYFSVSGFR